VAGAIVYLFVRKARGDAIADERRAAVFAGAAAGALIGSRLLYWLCDPASNTFLGGKTIVGGLLGGLIGVEIAKKVLGVTQSTGDLLVLPLIAAM